MYGDDLQNLTFNISDLRFYFDSQSKNVIDHGRWGHKAAVALSLRQKLLNLGDKEFESASEAIDRIIGPSKGYDRQTVKDREQAERRAAADGLFAATGNSAASGSSGDEVSRI